MKTNPQLPFNISTIFDVHSSIIDQDENISTLEPKSIRKSRVEMTIPYGTGNPEVIGISGLPSNELQEYIKTLSYQKLQNNEKYSVLSEKFHPSALAAIGVIVEELTSDLMETWKKNIRQKLNTYSNYDFTSTPTPTTTTTSPTSSTTTTSHQVPINKLTESLNNYEHSIHSTLPNNLKEILINQMGGILPGPFEYSNKLFERYSKLQIQGINFEDYDEDKILYILQNRLEVSFTYHLLIL